jgi:hypothetical protein
MADETPEIDTNDVEAAYEAAITTFGSIAYTNAAPQAPATNGDQGQPNNTIPNNTAPGTPAAIDADDISEEDLGVLAEELGTRASTVLRKLVAKASGADKAVREYRGIMDELAPIREVAPQIRAMGAKARDEESQKMHAALDRIAKMGGEAIVGKDRNDRVARFNDLRPGMANIVSAAERVHKAVGGDAAGKSVWDIAADLWARQNPVAAQRLADEQAGNRKTFADTASRAAARVQPHRHTAGPSASRPAGQKPKGAMDLIESYLKGR